jgi:hypothetical protein
MTGTSGGEPAIAEVLTAINGLRVNGPEPVRALREDVLALGNRTQRLIDGLRGGHGTALHTAYGRHS